MISLHRRSVLRSALGATGLLQLGLAGRAVAAAAGSALTASDLPGGLTAISGAGATVVCASGPDGAVVVDSGLADRAGELSALLLRRTGAKRIATVFNTCWRLEHTGGNDALGAAGARIVAHENTREWMGTEIDSRWENKVYPPRAMVARPSQTFYTTAQPVALGDERIEYGYLLQAHTDGDIYVFFRKANVLVVGGAVAGKGWPVIDWSTDGWIGGMVRGLETLIKISDDKTVIIPADGTPLSRADLEKQRVMYVAIMARLQQIMESGEGTPEVLKARPAADYEAERGDPTQFLTLAFKSFWGNVRQFKAI
jgi:glyoxylase-like metal-dependent hydrolase (beta-lactamase superfamily II)